MSKRYFVVFFDYPRSTSSLGVYKTYKEVDYTKLSIDEIKSKITRLKDGTLKPLYTIKHVLDNKITQSNVKVITFND